MKKAIPVLLFLALLAVPAVSSANTINVGVEAAFLQPMSDFEKTAGFGLGGFAKAELYFLDGLGVTGRLGYIYHFEKTVLDTDLTYTEMPVLIGLKYLTSLGLYGEIGTGFVVNDTNHSDPETKLGFMVGAGFELLGFNLGVNLYSPYVAEMGDGYFGLFFLLGWGIGI